MDARQLLDALEPTAGRLLDRHLAQSKEWFPHQLVPWSQGRDFEPGWEWSPEDAALTAASEPQSNRQLAAMSGVCNRAMFIEPN